MLVIIAIAKLSVLTNGSLTFRHASQLRVTYHEVVITKLVGDKKHRNFTATIARSKFLLILESVVLEPCHPRIAYVRLRKSVERPGN